MDLDFYRDVICTMALIGLHVPAETARLMNSIKVPGVKQSASDMHITIIYLGKDTSIETIASALTSIHKITSQTSPFLCGVKSVSSFPKNPDDGIPIILPVLSPRLHILREQLVNEFTSSGIEFNNKYPEYKPHVTMSYVTDDSMSKYNSPMDGPLTWTASQLFLWGGNDGDEALSVNFPFVLGPLDRIARRL